MKSRNFRSSAHNYLWLGCSIAILVSAFCSLAWGRDSRENLLFRDEVVKELSFYVRNSDASSRKRFLSAVKNVGICKEINYGMGKLEELYPYKEDITEYFNLLEKAILQGKKSALGGDREAVAYLFALVPLANDGGLAEAIRKSIGAVIRPYPVEFLKGLELCWVYLHADDNDFRLRGFLTMLDDDFVDDFKRQKIELESRRNVLANTKDVNEKIKNKCLSILDRAIRRTEEW